MTSAFKIQQGIHHASLYFFQSLQIWAFFWPLIDCIMENWLKMCPGNWRMSFIVPGILASSVNRVALRMSLKIIGQPTFCSFPIMVLNHAQNTRQGSGIKFEVHIYYCKIVNIKGNFSWTLRNYILMHRSIQVFVSNFEMHWVCEKPLSSGKRIPILGQRQQASGKL